MLMLWGFFIHTGYEGNDHCKKQKQYTQAADGVMYHLSSMFTTFTPK